MRVTDSAVYRCLGCTQERLNFGRNYYRNTYPKYNVLLIFKKKKTYFPK